MSFIVTPPLETVIKDITEHIDQEMFRRSFLATNELRNSAMLVLRGARGGRTYRVPGTKRHYTASAPGEVPAVRTGAFRAGWQPVTRAMFGSYISRIENSVQAGRFTLGEILENGTPGGQMAPRPHHDKILAKATPKIVKIYDQPYF